MIEIFEPEIMSPDKSYESGDNLLVRGDDIDDSIRRAINAGYRYLEFNDILYDLTDIGKDREKSIIKRRGYDLHDGYVYKGCTRLFRSFWNAWVQKG